MAREASQATGDRIVCRERNARYLERTLFIIESAFQGAHVCMCAVAAFELSERRSIVFGVFLEVDEKMRRYTWSIVYIV